MSEKKKKIEISKPLTEESFSVFARIRQAVYLKSGLNKFTITAASITERGIGNEETRPVLILETTDGRLRIGTAKLVMLMKPYLLDLPITLEIEKLPHAQYKVRTVE